MSAKNSPTYVVTGRARASYVNVFQPRLNELSGREEFGLTLLVPKSDTETIAKLRAAANAAREAKWGSKPPAGLHSPIHDGDGMKPNGGEYGEECRGHWVVNVKSRDRPHVVDENVQPIVDPSEFQSGDYCRVSLRAFGYDNRRKGVSFGLNNVQRMGRGDSLNGRRRAEDEFGPAETGENTAAAGDDAPW